jgi:hypothetical protein
VTGGASSGFGFGAQQALGVGWVVDHDMIAF